MNIRFNRAGGVALLLCLLVSLFSLAGCQSGGTEVGNPSADSQSSGFADDRQLEIYVKEQLATTVVEGTWNVIMDPSSPTTNDGSEGDAEARDHSDTNIQEPGVDEADKMKTDGSYLYVAQQAGVRIVKLEAGGAMSAIAQVPAGGPVDSLYLYQSKLVALYHPTDAAGTDWCGVGDPSILVPCWIPAKAQTGVLIVDVQDPSNPVQLSNQIFDGSLVSSRRIEGKLHLVSRFMPDLPPLEHVYYATVGGKDDVVQRNRDALKGLSLNQLLPSFESRDAQGNVTQSGRLIATENFLRPTQPQGGSIVTISTFDLDKPQDAVVQSIGAVLDARHVYASTAAMYLAAETLDADGQVNTFFHKFDLNGERVAYAASGSVPGSVLNQFSLGEYEGVLRVATSTWSGGLANHVYCLRQEEGGLSIVGRLENLAPGERLYAARFIGTRGFLVTFVMIDPLFTLDLSDPTAPKVVGELKVPGYSDYIHPLGEDFLLTIGKSTTLYNGSTLLQGLQLSIFDVRDFANPALLFKEEIGVRGTGSQALYDHKAFTYWAANGLLAIPVNLYEFQTEPATPWAFGQPTFAGLYVYRVNPDTGFTFLGRIDTGSSIAMELYAPWTRGLFAAESVYAVTAPGIFSAQLSDIENTVTALNISP